MPGLHKRKKILELKCWNHITTGEARRMFQLQNMKYLESVKVSPASTELQDTVTSKFEALIHGLIHHPWLNPDQRLKGNLHEQANADRNVRLDVSPNWRVCEKLVWLEG
ncbi:hypothetical protein AVEN_115470-1 [Araneus ventricosus]|uniref:Uncharacterized protein n=1 Tax=Araneus ventricosus TaxID=182803 RepID=A0A4Y2B483_ARAVE|nr:hypothetical protein AVEN_115470-1 [Araneus ventricosus]